MIRAVICERLDGPEALAVREIAEAAPGADEISVAVHAAALNFPDVLMTRGAYQLRPPLPFTPGLEAAGEVLAVGPGVSTLRPGMRVMTGHRFGAFAEEAVVPASSVQVLPGGLSYAEGAAFRAAYSTAYVALVRRASLVAGEWLLVLGAAGGVGMAAVDVGKLLGARVIACASSQEKCAILAARGADHVIDYQAGFRDRVLEITQGAGADVVFDPVGGDAFDEATRAIAWGGRLLAVGFASGRIATIGANIPLIKGFSVVGVRAGEFGRRNPALARENAEILGRWASEGRLRPHISAVFPLERVADAMAVLEERRAIGKVVLSTGRSEIDRH